MNLAQNLVPVFAPAPVTKPVLKWAGGKGQLLAQIEQHLPVKLKMNKIERYIEPFVGGGAVFFDIYNQYFIKEAFLFDINPELIILYNTIKYDVEELINELRTISEQYLALTEDNRRAYYYQARDEYNACDKHVDANEYQSGFVRRAALTVFLNRTCFNGLFRVNSKKGFNVPFGKYTNPNILNEANLRAVSTAFQIATIKQADFAETLDYASNNSFVYYDPPYRPISQTSSFNSYTSDSFNDAEQVRLKEVFDKVSAIGALQLLSNSDPKNYVNDPFFDELYQSYKIHRVNATRLINSKASGRGEIKELLISNY